MNDNLTKSSLPRVSPLRGMSNVDLAVVSKLHRGREAPGNNRSFRTLPDLQAVARTVNRTANNNNDAKNLFQVLPDMNLAKSILINSILSPSDLAESSVLYSLTPNGFDDRLTGVMLAVIEDKFNNFYKINKDLYTYLENALFMKGSHPVLILPENSIDALINSGDRISAESLSDEFDSTGFCKSYGILGVPNSDGSYTESSFESLFVDRSAGASKRSVSMESATVISELKLKDKAKIGKVFVTDNLSLLRRPSLEDRVRRTAQADIYGTVLGRRRKGSDKTHIPVVEKDTLRPIASVEDSSASALYDKDKLNGLTIDRVERLFYKNRQSGVTPVQTALTRKQLSRETVGHPLWMNLPSEAVIPIHVPGNPRKHVGYFIVNDMYGNPLCLDSVSDYYNEIRSSLQNDSSMATSLLGSSRRMADGYGVIETTEIEAMHRTYQNTIETDLLGRLRSGVLTGDFELANVSEIYAMMLARSFSAKQTMLLYVPAEMMTYIAFDYNEYGVGKSLIEDGKTLGSMRAVMMVANTLGATANMINGKNVNFTLPEEDEDPAAAVAFMMGEYAKLNRSSAAIGETNPNEIINRLQEAAVTFTVQGNTRYPECRTEVSSQEGINKQVDKDWDDELRKRHYQLFSLTPEMVDGASQADFATTVVNQSIQLTKRVMNIQDDFNPFITDIVKNVSYSSGEILADLRRAVRESGVDLPEEYTEDGEPDIQGFVDDFIELIEVKLPSPETTSLKDKLDAFDEYSNAIDSAIKAQLDGDAMKLYTSETVSPDHVELTAKAIGMMLKRTYLREKNILPELDIFNAINESDDPEHNWIKQVSEEYGDRIRIVEKFIKATLFREVENKDIIDKNQQHIEALSNGDDVSFDESTTDDISGDAGDIGGDDDFSFDEPVEPDAEPEEEEEPEPDLDEPDPVQ